MTTAAASAPHHARALPRLRALPLPRPELGALLVLAAVLNLWALDAQRLGQRVLQRRRALDERRAGTRSCSARFDAAGVMTVDKPPLALWVQALSARAFGFHSLSILVPQALMGDRDRRRSSTTSCAAASAAPPGSSPASVLALDADHRRDLAPQQPRRAADPVLRRRAVGARPRARGRAHALAGAVRRAVGLGFEAKMAAALLVVPGIVAAYLWVAPRGRLAARRVSCSRAAPRWSSSAACWPVLVALTPGVGRGPWISGTSDN